MERIGGARGETASPGTSPDQQTVPRDGPRAERELPGKRWKTVLFLLVLCGLVYNTNGRLMGSPDTLPARLIPFSILLDGTTTLDRFFAAEVGGAARLRQAGREEQMRHYFLTPRNGRLYSTYPITTPALVTPLYAPVVWLKGEWTTEEIRRIAPIAEKLTASLIAALSVVGMYLLLTALTQHRHALLLVVAFAFATTTWTTSSQALWQHGPSVLFIILTLAVLARRPNATWLAGLSAGLAVDARLSNVFFLVAVIGVVGYSRRSLRSAAQVALAAAVAGLPVAAYNWVVFRDLRGGYAQFDYAFRGSLAEGFAGILISPSRGLLVYSPVLLAGFVGLYLVSRRGTAPGSPVYLVSAVFLVTQLVFFGWWDAWWGGWSYGPRLLTEAAAVLVVLSVPALERLHLNRLARPAFVILLVYSASVQAIGALAYTGAWDATPVNVDRDPGRLWDWQDSQIRRTASSFVRGEWLAGCGTVVQWLTSRCSRGSDDALRPEGQIPRELAREATFREGDFVVFPAEAPSAGRGAGPHRI